LAYLDKIKKKRKAIKLDENTDFPRIEKVEPPISQSIRNTKLKSSNIGNLYINRI
jgi:hypothetical protein